MAALDNLIADAVVSQLDDAKDSFPITGASVKKRFLPFYDLGDLKTPKIAVAPRTQARQTGSKRKSQRDYVIQVAPHLIGSHVEGEIDDANTALFVDLVESINDTLEANAMAHCATWTGSTTDPLYDPDQLQSGILRAVLTINYRTFAVPA